MNTLLDVNILFGYSECRTCWRLEDGRVRGYGKRIDYNRDGMKVSESEWTPTGVEWCFSGLRGKM